MNVNDETRLKSIVLVLLSADVREPWKPVKILDIFFFVLICIQFKYMFKYIRGITRASYETPFAYTQYTYTVSLMLTFHTWYGFRLMFNSN